MLPAFVGVDLGGTGIRLHCIVAGQDIAEVSFLTAELDDLAPPARVLRIAAEISGLVPPTTALNAVGLGATGPVDPRTGEITNEATLPQLSGIGLRRRLMEQLGVPVVIDNDSVAAALGEFSVLNPSETSRLLMITLGTGVGGCLLLDGQPLRTETGTHPEIGHLPVFESGPACYCGLRGCWEPQASRAALQARVSRLLGPGIAPAQALTVAESRALTDGDIRGQFLDYGRCVGRGLATLQLVYGPSVVVVGGGASRYFALFEPGIRQELTQDPAYCPPSSIIAAQLGQSAGAIGAALLASRSHAGWPSAGGSAALWMKGPG